MPAGVAGFHGKEPLFGPVREGAMGSVRFLATTEFEPTPGGTILHQRFAAPKTPKERAIMEQMLPSIVEAVRTSTTHLTELLDEELERRGRDAIEEPLCHGPDRMDRQSPLDRLPGGELATRPRTAAIIALVLGCGLVVGRPGDAKPPTCAPWVPRGCTMRLCCYNIHVNLTVLAPSQTDAMPSQREDQGFESP